MIIHEAGRYELDLPHRIKLLIDGKEYSIKISDMKNVLIGNQFAGQVWEIEKAQVRPIAEDQSTLLGVA